jgi:hypothetical protein
MKEFEKLILGNLQETVIAPALMRVASVSVAHPNAVRAAVPNIARTIQRSNFVRTGSQQGVAIKGCLTVVGDGDLGHLTGAQGRVDDRRYISHGVRASCLSFLIFL